MGAGFEGRVGSKKHVVLKPMITAESFLQREASTKRGVDHCFWMGQRTRLPPSSWKKFLWSLNLRENWIFCFPFFHFFTWPIAGIGRKGSKGQRICDRDVWTSKVWESTPDACGGRDACWWETRSERHHFHDCRSCGQGIYPDWGNEKRRNDFWQNDYYLKKVKSHDSNLNPFEIELMKSLLPGIYLVSSSQVWKISSIPT